MSDAENNNSRTDSGSAKDLTGQERDSSGGGSAVSSVAEETTTPSLTLPVPKSRTSPAKKRPSLSERLRTLAQRQKEQSERKTEPNKLNFVSSLTAPPPSPDKEPEALPSKTQTSTGAKGPTAEAGVGRSEPTSQKDAPTPPAGDGESEVAKTDRVTSLPFDVVAEAHFDTDNEIDPPGEESSGGDDDRSDFDDDHGADEGPSPSVEATDRMSASEIVANFEFENRTQPVVDDSTDRINSPVIDTLETAIDTGDGDDRGNFPPTSTPPSTASTAPGAPTFDIPTKPPEPTAKAKVHKEPPLAASAPSPASASPDKSSEFQAEDTQLFQSAFDNDPISARLSTLEGPAVGQDFLVNRMRNSVGRGTANSISVPDPAMSRMHFEIVQNPDQTYLIKDMRAVNGTCLNGEQIKEADLFHGDRIEAGQSTFQFVIPGDAPVDDRQRHLIPAETTSTVTEADPAEIGQGDSLSVGVVPRGVHRLLLIITISAAVLSIPLLGFLLHATVLNQEQPSDEAPQMSARELYFEGVEALRDHDFDRAEEFFEESQRVDPDFELPQAQLRRIEAERAASALIEEARARDDEDFDEDFLDKLRAIPRDSRYHRDAQDTLARVPHNEARLLFVDAQSAFDDGDLERSAELVDKVRAIEPEHEGARHLEESIAEALAADDEAPQEEDSRTAPAPSPPPRPASTSEREESGLLADPFSSGGSTTGREPGTDRPATINFMDGFNLYRAESLSEAIEHFDAIVASSSGTIADRAKRTADNIRAFKNSRNAGESAFLVGSYDDAADHFEQALRADESVVSGGSFQQPVTQRLAESLGRAGLRHLERGNYSRAFATLQRAQSYQSGHPQVATLRLRIDESAHSLYDRANSKKDSSPEEASQLFEAVTTLVSPDHQLHQSARRHLEEIP